MIDKLKAIVGTLDNQKDTTHRADITVFSDGSGFVSILDTTDDLHDKNVWFAQFETPGEASFLVRNYAPAAKYQKTADGIAAIIGECPEAKIPSLESAMLDHYQTLAEEVDIFHPEAIRRLYPIIAQLSRERVATID